ncbi:MAG: thioredoxin family protein [Eggerthellaceae bacterium]|nr:thioredoxin family protein [Eggerthellaceae bacterium]
MIELTKENFDENVTFSGNVSLVDFWGPGCAPCTAMTKNLEQLEKDFPDVSMCSMDVSAYPDVAWAFDVLGIPCVLLFKDGVEVKRFSGYVGKDVIAEALNVELGFE